MHFEDILLGFLPSFRPLESLASCSCHLASKDAMPEFIVLERGGVRWQIRPGMEHLFGPDGLRLDEWLAAGQACVVKHGPHRTVYHVVLPKLDFYLKHNRLADCRARLRELVRPSKARSECEHT